MKTILNILNHALPLGQHFDIRVTNEPWMTLTIEGIGKRPAQSTCYLRDPLRRAERRSPLWPVLHCPSRWSPKGPLPPEAFAPSLPAPATLSRPTSSNRQPSRDALPSPPRSDAGTNQNGPAGTGQSSMAGFEVIIYGRFWVIAEGQRSDDDSISSSSPLERSDTTRCYSARPFDGLRRFPFGSKLYAVSIASDLTVARIVVLKGRYRFRGSVNAGESSGHGYQKSRRNI